MSQNLRITYLAGFLFTIPLAITSYVNSSMLEQYIDKNYVGLVFAFASILGVIGMLELPKALTRYGARNISIYIGLISCLSLILIAYSKIDFIVITSFVLFFISNYFLLSTLDIFIEDFSPKKSIGKLRGLFISITSISWVLSQIISGSIIARSSFTGIYLFASLFMLLVSIVFATNLKKFKDPIYNKVKIIKTFLTFWKDKDLLKIYLINFILKFFYSWMVIYGTIYLHENIGFSWQEIGTIFAIMLTPFVFLSYPLGLLSDKIGEKKILIYGFLFAIFAVILIPFIEIKSLALFALILFISRIGAATIEVMSESYFFKKIKEEEADEVEFFRNTGPLSFMIGPILATIFLQFIPSFSYLFFILGTILMAGLLISFRLRDIK